MECGAPWNVVECLERSKDNLVNLEQEKTKPGPVVEESASRTSEETFHPFRWLHWGPAASLDGTVGNRSPHPPVIPPILALRLTQAESSF